MHIIITRASTGYNYTLIESKGYTQVSSGCGLTSAELVKVIASLIHMADLHDNSRALYMQALQNRVNQQYMQAYS